MEYERGIFHLPVMLREVMMLLRPEPGGVYVDATVGLGGHAEGILGRMGEKDTLICIDRDEEALSMASKRLNDRRCIFRKGKFSELKELVEQTGFDEVDGVLFDFGLSMMQLRDEARGFSFYSDEPLDMRMDRSQRLTAKEVVNFYPEPKLEKVLREFGEEYYSARIVKAIIRERGKKHINTCRELSELISAAYRNRGRLHPATKTFQALRIEVNGELQEIKSGLEASCRILKSGGRLLAVAYHSLEDRIVKNFMRDAQKEGILRVLTKKPLTPEASEIRENPSARSAKLRGAEKP